MRKVCWELWFCGWFWGGGAGWGGRGVDMLEAGAGESAPPNFVTSPVSEEGKA